MEWIDIFADIQGAMWGASLSVLEVIDFSIIQDARQERMVCEHMEVVAQAQERNRQLVRQAEAEHNGRLLADLFEEY
jgi:hypothetical protein